MTCFGTKSRCANGFTLAELLVATTLIAIIMSSVYTVFSTAISTWRSAESNYATFEDSRLALGLLFRELQAVCPGADYLFTGGKDELEFYTLAAPMNVEDAGEGARILWVHYRIRGTGDAKYLEREEAVVLSPLPPRPAGIGEPVDIEKLKLGRKHEFVLASGVRSFKMQYFWAPPLMPRDPSSPPSPVEPIILDENPQGYGIPKGMRMTLALENGTAPEGHSTFTNALVFRAPTSPLPLPLEERYRQSGR